jgi:predicted ATPase/DNA-binding SARP family transcriptional activator
MPGPIRKDTLTIQLFGPELRVSLAGLPLSGSAAPKTRALLAYLILNGPEFVSREAVAAALWPDQADGVARKNLRRHLSLLSDYLPPFDGVEWILGEGKFLSWNRTGPAWVDALEFQTASTSPALRAQALELYTGDLLSLVDEEWLEPIRERYRLLATGWLAELYEANEPYDSAASLRYARSLLRIDPLREDLLRRVMRLLAKTGDQSEALLEFADFRARLESELGVAPSPETVTLAEEIRTGVLVRPVAAARVSGSVRGIGTSFVGRDRDCEHLERLVATNRLVTVVGIGGLGKSRLVEHLVENLGQRSGMEVCRILASPGAASRSIAAGIALALGLPVESETEAPRLVSEHLRDRRLLLVIDGCEHQLDAVRSTTEDLLASCGDVRVIATSREPLGAVNEELYRLGPLDLPAAGRDAPADVVSSAAAALFLDRSHAFSPASTLTERESVALAEICRRLGGIPLAIELAAARRRLLSIPQIAERLSDPALVLDYAPESGFDQQHTIRQTIAWSYEALSSAGRAALRCLCIFEAPFALDAAERLIGSIDDDRPPLIELLSDLIDRALVLVVPEPHETRYFILDPIREYGLLALVESGAAGTVYDAALVYFLDFSDRLSLPEGEPAPRRAFDEARREHTNIRGILIGAGGAGANLDRAVSLLERMSLFWQLRGYVSDGRACTTALLASPWSAAAVGTYGSLLLEASTFARLDGDYDEARRFASACLSRARAVSESALEADALFAQAVIDYTSANLRAARSNFVAAMALYSARRDEARCGRSGANLALTYLNDREYEAAANAMTEAIAALRRGGHRRWLAVALGAMGYIERYRGNLDEAARYSRDALAEGTRTGDRQLAGSALSNLAFVFVSRNDAANARSYIRAGFELLSDGAFPFIILALLESFARLAVSEGKFDNAASALAALAAIIDRYSITRFEDDRALVKTLEAAVSEWVSEYDMLSRKAKFSERSIASAVGYVVSLLR